MSDLSSKVLAIQVLLFTLASIPVVVCWLKNKFVAIFIAFSIIAATALSWFNLSEYLQHLYRNYNIFKGLIDYIHQLEPEFVSAWDVVVSWVSPVLGVIVSLVLSIIFLFLKSNKTLRGTVLRSNSEIKRKIKNKKGKVPIKIGSIPLPFDKETRSVAACGEPGVGKTQMIMSAINVARKRREKGFCADAGGDLLSRLWEEGDIILAPDDARSRPWSPFAEIENLHDCTSMANALIPLGLGNAVEWNQSARKLCADITSMLWLKDQRSNRDFQFYVFSASKSELELLLTGTPSERLFDDGSDKMLSNILSILSTHLAPLQFLEPNASEDSFSIKEWVKSEDESSWLWLTSRDNSSDSLMPLRRAWIDIYIRSVIDLTPDSDRRIWGIFDELASAGQVEILKTATARGRKYGLVLFLGYQNLYQLYEIYGSDLAKSILSSAGHMLILRTPDSDTSEYLSRSIGDAEIRQEKVSSDVNGDIAGKQQVDDITRVVMPSEIMDLPDLIGYLKIAGVGWTKVSIPVISKKLKQKVKPYIPVKQSTEIQGSGVSELIENQLDEV